MKLRYYIGFLTAKLAIIGLKLTGHKGTNLPGELAIKICPDFLKYIEKPKKIVGITGTNGKTTVSNMVIDALKNNGIKTLNNNYGSNIHYGIATSLIKGTNIFGKGKYELGILEIDERATPKIFPYVKPDILLVTNLFRDSMKRNAHTEYIKWILEKNIPQKSLLLLNADDLVSSKMNVQNEKKYFGIKELKSDIKRCENLINDLRVCPDCGSTLEYEYLRYHHIGKAKCSNCDFKSQNYDYFAEDVNLLEETILMGDKCRTYKFHLISDGIHNIYNMISTYSILRELEFLEEDIQKMFSKLEIVGSRYSMEKCGDVFVANQMAKENNALGSSRAFDYVASQSGEKELILMMNCLGDEKHWSENTCWLYDCDFEFLNNENIKKIIVTGPRGKDYKLRLLLAGISEDKIIWTKKEIDAPDLLDYKKGEKIFIFYGTDSILLGEKVLDKTKILASERSKKFEN